ncbi:MAG TPA: amidohydrolase family protein [Gaiellaceae bacterium]
MRIAGGVVVTPEGAREADVVVDDGKIASIDAPSRSGDVDARGCLVLPAGLDPHAHPLADIGPATVSAAHGGTTTVLAFTVPRPGEPPAAAFERARDELVPQAAIDVRLHPAIWEPDRLGRAELEDLARVGARSVKLYLAFPELGMLVSDRTLYETLRDASRLGLLVQVHCESSGPIDALVEEAIVAGRTDARAFADTRPPLVEEEGVTRTLALARLAEAPVYLVHLTTAGSLDLVREARRRGQTVWAEACTHHLVLDEGRYDGPDPDRYVVVPPLRSRKHVEALWEGVADGTIDAIGSDHAQSRYAPPFPSGDFRSLPYGFAGLEVRLPLVLSEGTRRGIRPERLADLLAGGPARAFGLAQAKGAVVPGADADLVVWNPEPRWTIRSEELHDGLGDSPFAGLAVHGAIRDVFLRGREVGSAGG